MVIWYIGDIVLPSYIAVIAVIINLYKDPYATTSIMASKAVFFRSSIGVQGSPKALNLPYGFRHPS